jgi:hypothetical protein
MQCYELLMLCLSLLLLPLLLLLPCRLLCGCVLPSGLPSCSPGTTCPAGEQQRALPAAGSRAGLCRSCALITAWQLHVHTA